MKKLLALLVVALSSVTLHAQGVWIEENFDPDTGLRTGVIRVNGGTYTIAPGVDLLDGNFRGADLSFADLSGAELERTNFIDAKLTGARLPGVPGWLLTEISALKPEVETNTTEIAELKTMMEAMSVQMQQLNARLDDQQASIEEKDQQIAELSQRPTLEEVQDARAGSLVFRADEETNSVTLEFEIQSSENLQDWVAQPETVTATVPLDAEKKFVRIALAQE